MLLCMAQMMSLMAQVKGHSYYDWEGSLGDDIQVEVLLEIDHKLDVALGEICYKRKGGTVSSIRLYGELIGQDETGKKGYMMMERLPSGKLTGILVVATANDVFAEGKWLSPDETREYPFLVRQNKPFPFSKYSTFFTPITDERELQGVYSTILQPKKSEPAINLNLVINDNRGTSLHQPKSSGLTHSITLLGGQEQQAEEVFSEFYEPYDVNQFMFSEDGTTVEGHVFRDFIYIKSLFQEDEDFHPINLLQGFFIRQPGQKWIPMPYFGLGSARLRDGKVTVSFHRAQIEEWFDEGFFPDYYMCPEGVDLEVENVAGNVRDIFCGDLGNSPHPVLSLLLDDGRVQIFSAMHAIMHGGMQVSQPLPDLRNIQYFTHYPASFAEEGDPMEAEYYPIYYGVDGYGEAHGIYRGLLSANWMYNFGGKGNYLNIEMDDNWNIWFHHGPNWEEEGDLINYYGTCQPVMSQDGTPDFNVYRYHFTSYITSADYGPDWITHECDIVGEFRAEVEYDDEGECRLRVTPISGNIGQYFPTDGPLLLERHISRG